MILWNGKDPDVFLGILECVEKKYPVEVAAGAGIVKTVSTWDDVRSLLPPRKEQTELSRQEYTEVLETFMPSVEMREHLMGTKLDRRSIIELILGAPVSMEKKEEVCRRLSARDDVFHRVLDRLEDADSLEPKWKLEMELGRSFTRPAGELRTALDALQLQPGEILLLNEAWYDEDDEEDRRSGGSVPFLSVDAALRYLRDEIREEEWDETATCWTELEKWSPGEDGEMLCRYRYILIRDAFVFFEKTLRNPEEHWFWRTDSYDYGRKSVDLNLPVPYRPGDIVYADCRPFAPLRRVVLLEVSGDCCGVTCLFPTQEGKWETGALKHGHFMQGYRPFVSPLYQISLCTYKLPAEERLLEKVREYIAGDREKGEQLWNRIHALGHSPTENEVLKLIGGEA